MGQRRTTRQTRRRLSVTCIVATAFALAVLLRWFVVDMIIVRGDSMLPTIRPGSVLAVWRCAYGLRLPLRGGYLVAWSQPEPGELVLVEAEGTGTRRAVKRVFEVGPAFMRAEGGLLSARGGDVPLKPDTAPRLSGSTFLRAGSVFVVGDNEALSIDSRYYGAVPIEAIGGKVLVYGKRVAR